MGSSDYAPTLKRSFSQLDRPREPFDVNGRQKRYQSSSSRKPSSSSKPDETVFRMLSPASQTGGIIGKGGSIIKSIRRDTGAMIRIEDAIQGVDVRVVTISARAFRPAQKGENELSKNIAQNEGHGNEERVDGIEESQQADEEMRKDSDEGHVNEQGLDGRSLENGIESLQTSEGNEQLKASPAQEALLRVFLRIVETTEETQDADEQDISKITAKLLVPTSEVGCVLGKKGKIIEQMREETRAQIRILSADQTPPCAAPTDEVVQIVGDIEAVKKALLAVSSRLQENPVKVQGQAFPEQPPARGNLLQKASSSGFDVDLKTHVSYSRPVVGEHTSYPSDRSLHLSESFPGVGDDVTFRILCPKEKVGSIIGKGGSIVSNIREETGAKIRIDVSSPESEERVILINATEHMDETLSKAQAALMRVHSKIIDPGPDKDAVVTTKLLVPSDQVGCLIGKGGAIIAEMRKVTRANIRIYGKEHLPPGASESDELVQIVGDIEVSQAALMRIATRLRNNLFHGKYGDTFKPAVGINMQGGNANLCDVGRRSEASWGRLHSSLSDVSSKDTSLMDGYNRNSVLPISSSRQSQEVGRRGFSRSGLQLSHEGDFARSNTAIVTSTTVEVVVPERLLGSIIGHSGNNLAEIRQISGAAVKLHKPRPGALGWTVEISGTPEQTHSAQSLLQAFILSGQ